VGALDTHTNQRGSAWDTQDTQLAHMAKALAAFDATNRANGLDENLTTLMMSDFGRHVPSIATDQVGASVMQWLGLQPADFHEAFPFLANFTQKTIPLLRT
jgi:uncharacterized protein (DUF1501 family)